MGYETPLVVKDVYLPLPSKELSFEEYKELYGIDLNDILYLDVDNLEVTFKGTNKIYLVATADYLYVAQYGIAGVTVAMVDFAKLSNDMFAIYAAFSAEENAGLGMFFYLKNGNKFVAPVIL